MQQGDTVTAFGLYAQAQPHGFFFSLASFVARLLHPASPPPPGLEVGRRQKLPLLQVGLSAGLASLPQLAGGVPQGYLRLLIFNRDSALVSQQVQQLTQAALGGYEPLRLQAVLPQDGYVTAYVGNESDVDVFFDDVSVEHRPGLHVQEVQYDAAGLELAGLAPPSPGLRGLNNYRFNGKEFQLDLGLNWNHQDWRFLDPTTLHWNGLDPELENGQESWSPYAFGFDNAVRYSDANGREPEDGGPPSVGRGVLQGAINFVVGAATPLIVPLAQGGNAALHGDITPLASLAVPAVGLFNQAATALNGNSETKARVATEVGLTVAAAVIGLKGAPVAEASVAVAPDVLGPVASPKTGRLPSPGTKLGFVVTEDGTVMHKDVNELRGSLNNAGYGGTPTTQTTETGTIHNLPSPHSGPKQPAYSARIMNGQPGGGQYKGPRVVTTRNNAGDYVKPNGANFPNGTPKQLRKEGSHTHLD